MEHNKLSVKTKLGYGVCDLGGNLYFTVVAFLLLNYLTDTVGIAAGLAGIIIMIGKIWDAVTDPLVGFLSDRTKSRWGRRRPYILFGSFPLFLTMILMFTNPKLTNEWYQFFWGVAAFCLLCTAYTIVNIPYSALTPELSKDFHERSAINGYRFGFAVVGTLLGAGAALPLINQFADKSTGFMVMGTLFGFLMMLTAVITVLTVKEPNIESPTIETGFFETYLKVFRNKPYVIILLTYAVNVTAITIVAGVVIYYFKYNHGNEAATTTAMVIMFVTAMFFIPISVILAKKIGKKAVYGLGMAIISVSIMILFLAGHQLGMTFSLATFLLSGIGMGFTYAMPYAMVPDAIEYNYLLTGERAEGAFYGIWTFVFKIGQAVALAITGGVLSLVGYVPDVAQTDLSLFGIRLLLGPVTVTIFVLAIILLYYYPINEKRYNEILEQIAAVNKNRL